MTAIKESFIGYIFYVLVTCFIFTTVCFGQNPSNYARFVDSADVYIDDSSAKTLAFLDSIPTPVEKYIEGRLADYYVMKALIHDDYNESAEVYKNYILAYKYAEKEKNFVTAGEVCLELFSSVYFAKRDSTGFKYLDKAKDYFEKANYKNGSVEVDQMLPYVKFIDGEFEACNKLLLSKMDSYRSVKDNAYYEMFATYMLISNYIYLDDFDKAHKYFNTFDKFYKSPSVASYNYFSFKTTIDVCFADVFLQRKNLDSTAHYLSKCSKLSRYMGSDTVEDYYGYYADYYAQSGNIEKSKSYLDSLRIFQDKIYHDVVNAGFSVNEELRKAENEIANSDDRRFFERFWIVILISCLVIIIGFILFRNWKTVLKVNEFEKKNNEFSSLKSNNEKLKLKIHSLEEYINDVKREVKIISSIGEASEQRNKIKELYKNVHLNSSTILSKEESHLELITELNVDFFSRISQMYPQLSDSEIIICYYLFSEFKSKEIAVFLSTTIRAIESKRYRISKKINDKNSDFTLYEFLNNKFGDLKSA